MKTTLPINLVRANPILAPADRSRRFGASLAKLRSVLQVSGLLLLLSMAHAQTPGGGGRKFRVSDPDAAARLVAAGGKLLVDYGAFQIIQVPAASASLSALALGEGAEPRDEDDRILLNAGPIDTTVTPAPAAPLALDAPDGKRLHLVHFAGPVKPEWVAQLRKTGVEVVTYLPNNAYLVYGDAAAIQAVRAPAVGSMLATFQDWEGAYQDGYKIDPTAKTMDAAGKPRAIGTAYFAVQMVADKLANPVTVAFIEGLATGPMIRSERKLNYYDVVAPLPAERLADVAARPDVISIQPYFMPKKFDERQDQIVAGNLTGNGPSGPGYLAWLNGAGFNQNGFSVSGFAVDVTDSGFDNGTTSPNHFGLYRGGMRPGNSRVIYNRLEGSANSGSTIRGVDGHGNLNGHIIGGFNNLTGAPHQDAAGFRYGLGVAPFVRLGSSVIFDPSNFTSPIYKDLQSRAYRDGARVSSNSWGADTSGAYNIDSQSYDALVRDAQPADAAVPAVGNQEMVIVFANGNAGSGTQTVGSPATGKNVISVGAAENVQAFGGADGSGVDDTGADNAGDIIGFSSRGPCADGRKKPEIVAPGTHVSGGVWQTANPGPNGTADPLFAGDGVSGGIGGSRFFPGNGSTQQFYTASSGTSHSTPCVAGGAALVRQYFLNRNLSAPSPAMTKGFLMNSSRYLTGVSANDTLPSNNQGMGEMNLGLAFDGTARFVRDQLAADKFTATGQTRVFNLTVVSSAKPLRVTLAWTDAPGSTTGNAYKNDLNLTVVAGGNTYLGNVFAGANSTTGGTADVRNNVESVFLPAGISGAITVTVTASNINSDGVPGDANLLDQDFALVAYDALPAGTAAVAPVVAAITTESLSPANGLIDNTETVGVSFTLQNSGNTAIGNLVATLQNTGGVTAGSAPQTYGALAAGAAATRAFSFTASGTPGGLLTATLSLTDGVTNLGTVTFSFRLAAGPVPAANGATIAAESLAPANGYIDPGEVVTVNFAISNTGDRSFGNLTATLLATGGVISPGTPQSYGTVPVGTSVSRGFSFTGSGAIGSTLTATLQLQDGAVNYGTVTYTFRIGPPPDPLTELFDTTLNDTDNQSWLFTPNGLLAFYSVVRSPATTFPSDPTGGTTLTLTLDSFREVTPPGVQVSLYGVSYPSFFVSSKGYVTFGSGDFTFTETLAAHFSRPRIAALFDDLDPSAGGTVSWKQFADRIAVTWQNVPEFGTANSNNFQIEMFFDGRIRITCLAIAATDGLIGLSRGLGLPAEFIESDFSVYQTDALQVTPTDGLTGNGLVGGPFTPSSQIYTLTNTGTAAINWTATNLQPWMRLSAASGTLAVGGSTTVTVSLRRGAAALALGTYLDSVVFTNQASGLSQTRPVSLTVVDPLGVSPAGGLTSNGQIGGPFTPASQVYTLTNNGTVALDWTATKTQPWLGLSSVGGTLAPGANATVTVALNAAAAALAAGAYSDAVAFRNVTSDAVQTRPVTLNVKPPVPDYFTEIFDTTPNDTGNQSWLFTPDGSISFYRVLRTTAASFPTDPSGGTTLVLSDDSFVQVTPTGGAQVRLYGTSYSTFFVGSNGYVTFGSGDSTLTGSLANHFLLPRIAALFDDLNPGSAGTVSWKQLTDRVAVTFQNVPEFGASTTNSFQIEMFFDGRVRITCLAIANTGGLIGLSRGLGTPADFVESDFSAYPSHLLQVNPSTGLTSTGLRGGPFTPSAQVYTLTNTGAASLNWTAAKTQPWLTLSSNGGSLAPGASTNVTVSLNTAALALALGSYADTVTITDTTAGQSQTRPVSLTVADPLGVSPAGGLTSSGPIGGPFTPTAQSYTLSNNSTVALNWTATKTQPWLTLSAAGGTLTPGASTTVNVALNAAAAALAVGGYSDTVSVRNVTSGVVQTRPVSLTVNPPVPNYFTELFDTTANDTDNQSWLFTPNTSNSLYGVVRTPVTAFPVDPAGGTTLILSDDNFVQVTPTGGAQVRLYGVSYTTFFVGSNGYVTFGSGSSGLTESLAAHFSLPRIAALFDDLDPGSAGTVSWKQLTDRVAVTFQNVPEFGASTTNSFQIEMFFDGRVRITCLGIAATDGLIGLSRGLGTPADFVESDFSGFPTAALELTEPGAVTEGDAPVMGAVTLATAAASDLVVSLASSDLTEATVPASVTIPAGQTSATFPITVLDDEELDGTQNVVITASAADYASAPGNMAVIDNETALIRGTPYEDWIDSIGITGPKAGRAADFDEDGVVNLLEWAFGTDPKLPSLGFVSVTDGYVTHRGGPTTLTVTNDSGDPLRFAAFARRKDYATAGLTYTVAFSGDLATWTATAATPTAIADDGEIEIVTVPYPAPIDGQTGIFFRVKVTAP